MDYQKIYYDFIKECRSKEGSIAGPVERHHIIPKARGGSNRKKNLVRMSVKDHLKAHVLMGYVYGGTMWDAVATFGFAGRVNDNDLLAEAVSMIPDGCCRRLKKRYQWDGVVRLLPEISL
jgi:hypothetical protein